VRATPLNKVFENRALHRERALCGAWNCSPIAESAAFSKTPHALADPPVLVFQGLFNRRGADFQFSLTISTMSRKSVGPFDKPPTHRLCWRRRIGSARTTAHHNGKDFSVRRALIIFCAIGFAVGAAAAAAYLELKSYAVTPASPNAEEKVVLVGPGQPLSATAEILFRRGLIQSPLKFRLLARLQGYDRRLKAGEYGLKASMTPRDILAILERGQVKLYKVTLPEGLTVQQIAEAVQKSGLASAAAIAACAADPAFARRHGLPAGSLEGYLFPDTYWFARGASAEAILTAMLQRFRSVFSAEWEQRAAQIGLTVHEVVTLASIIEKETGAPSERPLISSVFHNRLKKGMRLETDPTVIYGIRDFDGNLTRKHLETPTPYNTYVIKGLPPGPIASPGKDALEAALFPAPSGYFFFVAKNNGTHHFSISFEEHQNAVQRYQVKREGARPPQNRSTTP
jgi:UPF0755 protein